ncbi:MAG: ABC transporter permease [Gemmatimonadetes bacterium]|nr:ABC transporter permease [Gemmatimonadota bacterium]
MDLGHDARYALRRLIEARWFTLAAVSALSLGIGANATVFTFVNAVLLRGLPFEDSDRLVAVSTENESGQRQGVSLPDYEDLRDQSITLSGVGASLGSTINLSDDELSPERAAGAYVTAGYFDMIGEQPVRGRAFTATDDVEGADPVVLIGHAIWQNRFSGTENVVGRTVRVNSVVATVVGVMPEGMRFPDNTDLWIPQANLPDASDTRNRGVRSFDVIARLAPGVTLEQAREELGALGTRLAEAYPDTNAEQIFTVQPFDEVVNGSQIRIVFLSLMGAVAFVLLIACANVANLLLARSAERAREIAVRVSLGATRARIVRQLLIESFMVAVMSAGLGLVFSLGGIRWFDSVTQDVGKPHWMEFTLDGMVFAFMAAVCVGTALLFGLAPALHVSRTDVNEILKEGARGGSGGVRARRWAGALIVGEVALTLVLLSGAGFMMRSFLNLYTLDFGIDTDGLLTSQIYLPLTKYPEAAQQMVIWDDLLERLDDDPMLEQRALTSSLPLSGGSRPGVELDGRAVEPGETRPVVTTLSVSDGYFETLGLATIQGRTFNREDGVTGAGVAIVNQRFVELHFPSGDAVGRRVRTVSNPPPPAGAATPPEVPWLTVVGVVPNVRQSDVEEREPDPIVYAPLRQAPARVVSLLTRSGTDDAALTTHLREVMRTVEPDVPLYETMSLDALLAQSRWPFRVFGTLFAVFAGIALILSSVGLYSVTAHSVVQRKREFGIRASLGSEPKAISWLALRRVLGRLAIGLPLGLAGALGVGRILESLLVQTSPTDPITLGGVIVMMASVAVLACLLPARRAARIDPVIALRTE